jgi:hypothetical protein
VTCPAAPDKGLEEQTTRQPSLNITYEQVSIVRGQGPAGFSPDTVERVVFLPYFSALSGMSEKTEEGP